MKQQILTGWNVSIWSQFETNVRIEIDNYYPQLRSFGDKVPSPDHKHKVDLDNLLEGHDIV